MTFSLFDKRLGVPMTLLMLAMLALMVSLATLVRTTTVANERVNELNSAWLAVQDGSVEGSELIAADRLMSGVIAPAPVVKEAALWSFGLAVVSALLLLWLVLAARRASQRKSDFLADEERREQAAVMKLMDEIAPLASGDLRVHATVTDALTGSLADAFNYAVSELRWLVGTLGRSAEQVNSSVERSRVSAATVASACSEQSRQIHLSSNHLSSMSAVMAALSVDAAESTQAAQSAVAQAETGASSLSASLSRLSAIRDEADQTTRLMHRLADNVAAIDERVVNIQDVAKQTDLLALNTTIRASAGSRSSSVTDAAADLGRLSDEVSQLAEVLGQATRDIGSLTRTISEDAAQTVQSMEHTMTELAAGLEQTQQANDALDTIRRNSHELRVRVVSMADRTAAQSGIVSQLSDNMNAINKITRQTAEGVGGNADSLVELKELAGELKHSLADFRLPTREVKPPGASGSISSARRAADRAATHD